MISRICVYTKRKQRSCITGGSLCVQALRCFLNPAAADATWTWRISFGEQVVITPRNHPFHFHELEDLNDHHALIGMANVASGQPLYAEAMNEHGLYMAGLNFPGNACYDRPDDRARYHAAPYELIPWILGICRNVTEAKALLSSFAPLARPFSLTADGSRTLPLAELHWHICDGSRALVLETTVDGVCLYEDPIGVLTNNPPFPFHQMNLQQYLGLSSANPKCRFAENAGLRPFGEGMGALGLPGDASPASRYVKAAFHKLNSPQEKEETAHGDPVFPHTGCRTDGQRKRDHGTGTSGPHDLFLLHRLPAA